MENYNLKQYAHLGDAVWELFVRLEILDRAKTQKLLHSLTTKYVNAFFQADIINILEDFLSEEEKELVKKGRNLPLTSKKRNNPKVHVLATAFEVLIGYLYLNNKQRLDEIFEIIKSKAL